MSEDRFDVVNRDRFLEIVYGASELELGFVTGTYRNQPCELLVMVIEEEEEPEEGDSVTVVPLAAFLSEEDLSYIDIPFGETVETIEFSPIDEEEPPDPNDLDPKRTLH